MWLYGKFLSLSWLSPAPLFFTAELKRVTGTSSKEEVEIVLLHSEWEGCMRVCMSKLKVGQSDLLWNFFWLSPATSQFSEQCSLQTHLNTLTVKVCPRTLSLTVLIILSCSAEDYCNTWTEKTGSACSKPVVYLLPSSRSAQFMCLDSYNFFYLAVLPNLLIMTVMLVYKIHYSLFLRKYTCVKAVAALNLY